MTKKFVLQVECDERTRMLCNDEELMRAIKSLVSSCLVVWTAGSRPAVSIKMLRPVPIADDEDPLE